MCTPQLRKYDAGASGALQERVGYSGAAVVCCVLCLPGGGRRELQIIRDGTRFHEAPSRGCAAPLAAGSSCWVITHTQRVIMSLEGYGTVEDQQETPAAGEEGHVLPLLSTAW